MNILPSIYNNTHLDKYYKSLIKEIKKDLQIEFQHVSLFLETK